ncbi:MAG: HIP---CoA ligase [Pseudonocardiales bacterium]|jgi:acyl-CoA synthetase (AMP-forming)/AMP-acid ligase II|nr:HIP---CoA ligase [Pseudonocardiales bacterium]
MGTIETASWTTPRALREAARADPDAEALVDGAVRLSWREFEARVRAHAAFHITRGVQPGDRVAVWSPNTWHWPVAALAAHYAGATLVPINTRFTGHEALDILQRTGATTLVVAGPFLGTDRLAALLAAAGPDGLPALRTVVRVPVAGAGAPDPAVVEWADASSADTAEADERAAAVTPEDVSDIVFTSGTTGRSKGVMSAHRQALGVAAAWAQCGRLTSGDRYLVINPFFHSFGYKAGILACLLTGATIVPQAVFDVAEAMRLVSAERITVLPGPPTIYRTMLDAPERAALTSLRLAVTGAATVPVALVERMQAELTETVLTAYGLTEAVVVTMCRPDDDAETVARTCGRATAGFEVRIGEAGEILLRGPNVMLGYLDDPEATAQAIDAAGWLHTGDVGELDERGYLRITDRLKDMYICGGFNVYPAEVEQLLARLDGVAETAVIGVPDERLGEVGKVFVIRRPGATVTEEQVVAFTRERLANYKLPRYVEFRDDLPRNATGKPLKRLLRDEEKPHG